MIGDVELDCESHQSVEQDGKETCKRVTALFVEEKRREHG